MQVELLGHPLRRLGAEHAATAASRRVTLTRPRPAGDAVGPAVVPGHLDGAGAGRRRCAQTASPSAASGPMTSVAISPPAESSRSSDGRSETAARSLPMTTTSPSTEPEHVAGPAGAGGGERLLLGDRDLGAAGGGGGLGHRDHVVAETAARIGDGDGGQALHRRAGRDDADLAADVAGAGAAARPAIAASVGVVGQHAPPRGGARDAPRRRCRARVTPSARRRPPGRPRRANSVGQAVAGGDRDDGRGPAREPAAGPGPAGTREIR